MPKIDELQTNIENILGHAITDYDILPRYQVKDLLAGKIPETRIDLTQYEDTSPNDSLGGLIHWASITDVPPYNRSSF